MGYRQVKRLWRRYQRKGRKGLQHGNVGRASNRSKPAKCRRQVLRLIKQKYSGSQGERFGPTLAAEHLAEEDGITINHETLRGWMLAEGLWSRMIGVSFLATAESAKRSVTNELVKSLFILAGVVAHAINPCKREMEISISNVREQLLNFLLERSRQGQKG